MGRIAMQRHEGVDGQTVAALRLDRAALLDRLTPAPTIHPDAGAMAEAMAERMLTDIRTMRAAGGACTLIVPVGPVGQYARLAATVLAEGDTLSDTCFIVMDEYLDGAGRWIPATDPLSFRGHVFAHLRHPLPEDRRPRIAVPDPADPGAIGRLIAERGGVDVAYAGVGITGHLAFNDPEPGRDDPDWVATWPTRIVRLLPETRLINAVTPAGGDVQRIPAMAVTVGMAEILASRQLRVWMNRDWQRAVIRRAFCGPVTGAFPASLVQRHGDVTLDVTEAVLAAPEPGLR
jgi:glucosamine-6-phosphate deaminase